MGLAPPKKRRQSPSLCRPPQALSCWRVGWKLEEDGPEGHSSSSPDSSKPEEGSEVASLLEEKPQDHLTLPIHTVLYTNQNFLLGMGGIHRTQLLRNRVLSPPPQVSSQSFTLSKRLLLRALDGDVGAGVRCSGGAGTLPLPPPPPPGPSSSPIVSLKYTSSQLELAKSNLEAISKQVRDYMVSLGEWVDYVQPAALPHQMITSGGLKVPVTETTASLLAAILKHKGDNKGSSVNLAQNLAVPFPAIWVFRH